MPTLSRRVLAPLALVLALAALAAWLPAAAAAPAVEAMEGTSPPARSAAAADAERHPAAVAAHRAFTASMVHGEPSAEEVLVPLLGAYAADPSDAQTSLLVGGTFLRLAARGQGDPRAIGHLATAEWFLERAQRLAPEDHRIASFLVPIRLSLARIEGAGAAEQGRILADLYAAFEADPAFNSFGVAMIGFQFPRGSEPFRRGLEALRSVEDYECVDDPTCSNQPGWPHAVEGFVSFFADYELKAGNRERAEHLLGELRSGADYADWPFRAMAEERFAQLDEHTARFADDDPDNDPRPVVLARGCAACHHGS